MKILLAFLLAPVTASAWSSVTRSTRRSVIPDEYEEDFSSITRSTNAAAKPLKQHSTIAWLQQMALSYQLERGENLLDVLIRESISLTGRMDDLATVCAHTNLAIASHDFIRDPIGEPIYCYGNDAFLSSFEYKWEEFVELPSRYCVESDAEVKERNKLLNQSRRRLERTTDEIPELIRVTKNKRRILLQGVNLWNVYDFHNDERIRGYDGSTLRAKSIRDQIDRGDIKAIGQAVWIRQVVESI